MTEKLTLLPHQSRCMEKFANKSVLLYHDCGTGKTITALSLIAERKRIAVIICPKTLITSAWEKELKKYFPERKYVIFNSKTKEKGKIKLEGEEIIISNYEFIRRNYLSLKELLWKKSFDLILDETIKVKNPLTDNFKALQCIREKADICIGLSGNPMPQGYLDFFGQMESIVPKIYGGNFYKFRSLYGDFCKEYNGKKLYAPKYLLNRPQVARAFMQQGYKWQSSEEQFKEIMQVADGYIDRVRESEVVGLPEQLFEKRFFELNGEEKRTYKDMLDNFFFTTVDADLCKTDTALGKIMKLRQICGGLVLNQDKTISLGTSKINALKELLEEIGQHQVVIWAHFRADGNAIAKMLEEEGKSFAIAAGAEKDKAISDFTENKIQYIVCSAASCGHGITWTNCNYNVYYSCDYNYDNYFQSTKRCHRYGQTGSVKYYTLLAKDTVEEQIQDALAKKQGAVDLINTLIKS